MHFIDIAANLTDGMFAGNYNGSNRHPPDLSKVLTRATSAGVVRTMVTAGTLSQSAEALEICQNNPCLFSTVGVHPTRVGEMGTDPQQYCDQLLEVVRNGGKKVVAIGECGLDYDRTRFCSEERQLPGFVAQFSLAEATGLPMFLHDRNTRGDFLRVIEEHRSRFSAGVVHSFTGTIQEMQSYVGLDLYIGINGCSLKTSENLKVASAVPLDRIMLETDCPYCQIRSTHAGVSHVKSKWPAKDKKKFSPDALVKGRSEPCMVRQVCEVVAAEKGIEEEELARAAFNNTMNVFFPEEAKNMGSSPYDLSICAVPAITNT
ncbi:TatD related DNase [Gracilaria domingensis]|nr:TatD related DNase [Gracilaria domingensis]